VLIAAAIEAKFGIDAEMRSLESIADPAQLMAQFAERMGLPPPQDVSGSAQEFMEVEELSNKWQSLKRVLAPMPSPQLSRLYLR
jgi:hypothetical protein